jgi:E3 ubiquitin-protein ligase MUL1
LKKKEEEKEEEKSCVICFDSKSEIAFDCGHVCTCKSCSENVQICPICRKHITIRLRIIFV